MLKALRKNTKLLLWFAAGVFIFATFMGLGGYFFTRTSDTVLSINGKKISYDQFMAIYYERINSYRTMYNVDVNEEMAITLKKMILEDIIRRELLLQEARKRKIKVSNAELSQNIQSIPSFQKNGKFAQEIYLNLIKMQLHTTPKAFEQNVRESLTLTRLREQVQESVTVSDKEIDEELTKRYTGKKLPTDPLALAKEKEQIRQTLLSMKKFQAFDDWYKELKNKAKIENNMEEVEKTLAGGTP